MAPKASMKRPASAVTSPASGRSSKRVAVVAEADPVVGLCETVQQAVGVATELPEDIRRLLASLVPTTLGVLQDQRHDYQERVVEWIGGALRSAEAGLQAAVADAATAVAAGEEERTTLVAASAAADAELQRLKAAVQEKKEALASAQGAVDAAAEALAAAQATQTAGDTELVDLAQRREALEGCKGTFAALREGAVEATKVEESCAKVCAAATQLDLEGSLQRSLPSALRCAPEQRGDFAQLVLGSFETEVESVLGDLGAKLEAMRPEADARAAAVAEAQAAFDNQREKQTACKAEVTELNKSITDARQAVKCAGEALAAHDPKAAKAEAKQLGAVATLSKFQEGALKAYSELRERTTPPAPEPEPVAQELPSPEAPAAPMEATAHAEALSEEAALPAEAAADATPAAALEAAKVPAPAPEAAAMAAAAGC